MVVTDGLFGKLECKIQSERRSGRRILACKNQCNSANQRNPVTYIFNYFYVLVSTLVNVSINILKIE
ncbi:hypothetical protein DUE52_25335 [Larkinella punicea]|uniref:Uncharacterized protein n=1 Tax=Larkinella punicea TaxID=2315727 RepID=A0A368JG48_9BACT|nr:hypothetical protein DUE52_25335 [Larkinella punicea]